MFPPQWSINCSRWASSVIKANIFGDLLVDAVLAGGYPSLTVCVLHCIFWGASYGLVALPWLVSGLLRLKYKVHVQAKLIWATFKALKIVHWANFPREAGHASFALLPHARPSPRTCRSARSKNVKKLRSFFRSVFTFHSCVFLLFFKLLHGRSCHWGSWIRTTCIAISHHKLVLWANRPWC